MAGMLDGKAGLVTGAASGIGRACAVRFAAEGAAVVVADLESARAGGEETVRTIESAGGRAEFFPCDVAETAANDAMVERVVEAYGRLDFAHNNAGIGVHKPFHEHTDEDFDRVIAVNLRGTFLGMRAQIRRMLDQDTGTASKHGILGLTKNAAVEYADDGIRVNAVCPGAIMTPLMSNIPPERQAEILAPQAMTRPGQPEEVAAAVVWLCSDDASFVTGVSLPVDAGSVAWVSAHR